MSKTFINLNRVECKIASKEAFKNADKHIEIAEKLETSKDYGIAISHLIMGNEEIIKGFILHLDSVGFTFRQVKGLESIFRNHQLRYLTSYILFALSTFLEESNLWLAERKVHKTFWDIFSEFVKMITSEDQETRNIIMSKIITKLEFLLEEIKKFSDFDNQRQQGNYVDFNDELHTPLNKTEKDYMHVKERVIKVKDAVSQLVLNLNLETYENSQSVNEILVTVQKENIYDEIELFLKNAGTKNSDRFHYVSEKIQSLIAIIGIFMNLKEVDYPDVGVYSIIKRRQNSK